MANKTIFQTPDLIKYTDIGCTLDTTQHMGIPTNSKCDNIETILITESEKDYNKILDLITTETPNQQGVSGLKKAFIVPGLFISNDRLHSALKEHKISITNDLTLADFIVSEESFELEDQGDKTFRSNKILHHKQNMYIINNGPADDYHNRTSNWMLYCDKISKSQFNFYSYDYESAPYDVYGITGLAIELANKIRLGELKVVSAETVMVSSSTNQNLTEELIEQLKSMANGSSDDKELMLKLIPTINYTSEPALLYILIQHLGSHLAYTSSRSKDLDWWKEKSNYTQIYRSTAEDMIISLEEKNLLDAKNFRILEPLCRKEINIHNRNLYNFIVQVKPEYKKYLK